jgi:hypothetical protein
VDKRKADELVRDASVAFVIANRSGTQIPGKIFDLALSSAAVVILHETRGPVPDFPFASRVQHVRNDPAEIISVLRQDEIIQHHDIAEYSRGEDELRTALASAFA